MAYRFIFASLFERRFDSSVVGLRNFDSVTEYCVRCVSSQHLELTAIVDLCVVKLLKVGLKLFGHYRRDRSQARGVVFESFLTRAILDNYFSFDCLIIDCANIVIIIAVFHLNCTIGSWRFFCRARSRGLSLCH